MREKKKKLKFKNEWMIVRDQRQSPANAHTSTYTFTCKHTYTHTHRDRHTHTHNDLFVIRFDTANIVRFCFVQVFH